MQDKQLEREILGAITQRVPFGFETISFVHEYTKSIDMTIQILDFSATSGASPQGVIGLLEETKKKATENTLTRTIWCEHGHQTATCPYCNPENILVSENEGKNEI